MSKVTPQINELEAVAAGKSNGYEVPKI